MRNTRPRDALGRPLEPDPASNVASPTAADEPALAPLDALARAQKLLNTGRPFEAHEVLEAVWKTCAADQRELWRGLAQLAVGVTHALRGNDDGARALLRRGSESLSSYSGTSPYAVDVDGLRAWADRAADDLTLADHPIALSRD